MTNEADTVKVELLKKMRDNLGADALVGITRTAELPVPVLRDLLTEAIERRLPHEAEGTAGWENLSCDDQYDLARRIASNVGYVLVAEPDIDPWPKPTAPSPAPGELTVRLRHTCNVAEAFLNHFNLFDLAEDKAQQWQSLEREISLSRAFLARLSASPSSFPDPEVTADTLRAMGWAVAVHNDYRQSGVSMTFWLFTSKDGRWIKGEGKTDAEALAAALASIKGGQ